VGGGGGQSGRLQHYTGVDDPGFAAGFKEPCVVFCGHPSLRCGEVIHFINTWGHEARNAIIFTGKTNKQMRRSPITS
jgi:integrator complex subunit 9